MYSNQRFCDTQVDFKPLAEIEREPVALEGENSTPNYSDLGMLLIALIEMGFQRNRESMYVGFKEYALSKGRNYYTVFLGGAEKPNSTSYTCFKFALDTGKLITHAIYEG